MSTSTDRTEVVVIGAGPGGYTAALRAAQLGKQVTLIEKQALGGICLNSGCIPSKALIHAAGLYEQMLHSADSGIGIQSAAVTIDFPQVQKWKQGIVDKLGKGIDGLVKSGGIRLLRGNAAFTDPQTVEITDVEGSAAVSLTFEHCIIATGSRPLQLRAFPYGGKILSSTEALQLTVVPKRLIVIGGGYIGVELGQTYAKLGAKVAMLEGEGQILPAFDLEIANYVIRNMKTSGMEIVTGAVAQSYALENEGIRVTYQVGDETRHTDGDYLLVAVGRTPNTDGLGLDKAGVTLSSKGLIAVDQQCRSANPHVFAIGDVTEGFALAHKASYEAKIAAEVIAGHAASQKDNKVIPAVVFSDPEIAVVGLSAEEAKQQNLQVKVGKFNYGASGRALTADAGAGYVKVIADTATGMLLGAQIVGAEASNLVAEVALAIEMGATLEDIALTIHAHPTLSEMILEASEEALGQGIHSQARKLISSK